MRHGRKSAARKWSGYKQHIMTDPETELVTAVAVSPASAGDGSLLPELLAQQEATGLAPSQVVGDQAYGGGALRESLAPGRRNVAKAAPISNGEFFSKDEFAIVVVPNAEYVRFATHFGFQPDFCEAADPESKGVVEALVGYAKRDLVVPAGGWRS